jgi:hypothetical protein
MVVPSERQVQLKSQKSQDYCIYKSEKVSCAQSSETETRCMNTN